MNRSLLTKAGLAVLLLTATPAFTAPGTDPRVPEVKTVLKDLVVGNNLQAPKSEPAKKGVPAKKKP